MKDFHADAALTWEGDEEDLTPIGHSEDDREAYNEIQDRPIAERVAEGMRADSHVSGGIVPFPTDARGNDALDTLPPKERAVHERMCAQGYIATAYDYTDAEGRLLIQIVHYRHEKERKQVRQLRYCGRSKTTGEHVYWWTGVPGTRPLYNLQRLIKRPDLTVLVVEGEKAAKAADYTFLGQVVVCWPGGAGSGAVDRVDVSMLAGRKVVGWPDNDPVGRSGMRRFLARAIEAGAASAAMVIVPREFPAKWDLADPVPADLHTSDLLPDLIDTARPMTKSEARKLLHDPRKKAAARRVLGLRVGYSRVDPCSVETCLSLIDPDESGHWFRALRTLYYAYGMAGLPLADEWSRRGAKYREGEPKRLFDKFAQDEGFTADSLLWLFREGYNASLGVDEDKPNVAIDFAAFCLAHVENMNRDHAVVTRGSKTVVMWETYDERFDRYAIDYLPKLAFQDRYVSRVPVATDKEGNPVFKPRGKHWFDDGRRRQFDRIVFLPGRTTQDGVLNSWRGFAVEPVDDPEGWSLFKTHLYENVCNKDAASFAYLMCWLAACVQWLHRPLGVALVLMGHKGAGKSILIQLLAYLFGDAAFVTALADDVLGKFNARLEHTLLLGLEEAVAASNRTQDGIFKDLITRPTLRVEDKFFSNWTAPNHLRMIMTSNNDHVVRADARERRYAVFEVTNPHQDDPDARRRYFGDIIEQMETGGYEAMLGELLARDISGWNPESIPETDALRQQKLLNLSNDPVAAWYFSRLQDGINILSGEADTPVYPWSEMETRWVPVAAVMKDYRQYARQLGHRGDEQRIKTRLTRFMPRGFDTKNLRDPTDPNKAQARMYPFPPLIEARKLFERATGYSVPVTEEGSDSDKAAMPDDGPTPF